MDIVSGIVVYILIWWVTIFAVLPWGNHPCEDGPETAGPGVPSNPRLKQKFIVTTILSALIWLVVFGLMRAEIINFHDLSVEMYLKDTQ